MPMTMTDMTAPRRQPPARPRSLRTFSQAIVFSVALLQVALVLGVTNLFAQDDRPPNVVYIMADELGYYELACQGHPLIQTPNIDQMAREGIVFRNCLAGSSLCAPTRCCLMTGKHSGHTSVRANSGGTPLRADEATIASMLKQKNYATGGFGKWGCGGRGSTGVPEKHGFDTFFGYYDQVHAHSYYPPYLIENSREVPLEGNQGLSSGTQYSHYLIYDRAVQFIRDHRDEPFFCYLPITPPHGLFDIPDSDPAWQIYKDKPWPEPARRYAAMITMVDRQVGELLDLLKQLELDRNTIVFFCGDNGGNDYFSDAEHPRGFFGPNVDPKTGVEFRGKKGQLYEGGLKLPMIARWPGKIEPGRTSDLVWYFPDVMPTLAELTGTSAPADTDGISIAAELLGEDAVGHAQPHHDFLYWELGPQVAIRQENWKAIRPRKNQPWELYDLANDPSETNDLADVHPALLGQLVKLAEQAHEPVREGRFFNRMLHERDRRAKFGKQDQASDEAKPQQLDPAGLLDSSKLRIVSASSEAVEANRLAQHALDGDPTTHWHTEFQPDVAQPPHELVIDLGESRIVHGVRYLARQDRGWNGAFGKVEFFVSDAAEQFGDPVATAEFSKTRQSQQVNWPAAQGRYVKIRILTEINGGPWASAAEIGIIGE